MNVKIMAIAAFIGSVVGFLASAAYTNAQLEDIDERLSHTRPVVVADLGEIAARYPSGASPEELEKLMVRTRNAMTKLSDAGYIVLDRSSVLAAPSDIDFPVEVLDAVGE